MDIDEAQVFYDIEERGIEALAEHIERGGIIGGHLRDFLAKYLRKQIKFKRGNKRTRAQAYREHTILEQVAYHYVFGKKKTIWAAMKSYLDHNPRESANAVKAYLKAAQQDHRWGEALQLAQRLHDRLGLDQPPVWLMCRETWPKTISRP